jgi:hypothetical protein
MFTPNLHYFKSGKAVLWLISGLSRWRQVIDSGLFHVRFVADEGLLTQALFRVLQFPCVSTIHSVSVLFIPCQYHSFCVSIIHSVSVPFILCQYHSVTLLQDWGLLRSISVPEVSQYFKQTCFHLENIVNEITQYQQKWLQHLQRMDTNRIPKQTLQYRPKGRRNIERRRKSWREQLHLQDQEIGNTPNPSCTWRWWW